MNKFLRISFCFGVVYLAAVISAMAHDEKAGIRVTIVDVDNENKITSSDQDPEAVKAFLSEKGSCVIEELTSIKAALKRSSSKSEPDRRALNSLANRLYAVNRDLRLEISVYSYRGNMTMIANLSSFVAGNLPDQPAHRVTTSLAFETVATPACEAFSSLKTKLVSSDLGIEAFSKHVIPFEEAKMRRELDLIKGQQAVEPAKEVAI